MMDIIVKEISPEEFREEERKIRDSHTSIVELQQSWTSLDNFFRNQPPSQDKKYYWTYFRVYVDLSWKLFNALESYTIISMVFARQIPMAILLDVDVLNKMMWYLSLNNLDKNALVSLYQKIKSAFFESEEIMGEWQGVEVTIKELISEYILLQDHNASSMEEAEFISKLKQIMFPKQAVDYILVNSDVGVDRFLELVEMFQVINNENLWFVVDVFSSPEKYQNSPKEEESVAEISPTVSVLAQKTFPAKSQTSQSVVPLKPPEEPKKIEVEPVEAFKPVPIKTPVVELPQLIIEQIKSQVESQFPKDNEGNFIDIEAVMAKLSELAEKYNNPKIADMIYFDEKENKFKWSI